MLLSRLMCSDTGQPEGRKPNGLDIQINVQKCISKFHAKSNLRSGHEGHLDSSIPINYSIVPDCAHRQNKNHW